ncbi:MAG: enoyl-CoA hydratase/isomerase family protein [Mangrovicoccus sp.]
MIEISKNGDIWTAILNRPEKANAVDKEMLVALADFAEEAHGQAKVIVLTGRGKAFSGGMDLEAAKAGLPTDPIWERLSNAIANFEGLSIAALNGSLAGGAFGMVLACDIRISVENAKFFYPVMKLGFLPQPSDPARLAALIGPARAKMILMAAAKIHASEALAWGLIDQIVDAESLESSVAELAAAANAAEMSHITAIKHMI